VVPQNLYFYTLACSPVEERDVCLPVERQGCEEERRNKGAAAQMRMRMRVGAQRRVKGTRRRDFGITSLLRGANTGLGMGMSSLLLLVRSLLLLVGFMGTRG
jgi:hypothetical protein